MGEPPSAGRRRALTLTLTLTLRPQASSKAAECLCIGAVSMASLSVHSIRLPDPNAQIMTRRVPCSTGFLDRPPRILTTKITRLFLGAEKTQLQGQML